MSAQPAARRRRVNPVSAPGRIRCRPDRFTAEELRTYGWESPTAAARDLGVSSSTLRRALAGTTTPGERLIAALMQATGRQFEYLFTIEDDT
jgi:transcriptional regulator with XRE-family HTH domain